MDLFRYAVRYRRTVLPGRIVRVTVTAHDADDARRIAAMRDPQYGSSVEVHRRERVILEEPDGMDQAKAREFVEWRGTMVEVVD